MVKHMILTIEGKGELEFRLRPKPKEAILYKIDNYRDPILDIPSTVNCGSEEYSVVELRSNLFYNYSTFDEVIIPDSVKKLHNYLFCSGNIKKVVLGNGIKAIPDYCFRGSYVKEVVLSEGIETIGDSAFYGTSNLKTIVFPKSLKSIHTYAFQYSGLSEITIPESVEIICSSAFTGCKNLRDVYFNHVSNPPKFHKTSGNIFPHSKLNPIILHVSNNIYNKYKNIACLSNYHIVPSINSFSIRFGENGCYITCKLDENGRNSYCGDLVLPEKYFGEDGKEHEIIGIDDFAFTGCKELKSVSFDKSSIKYSELAFFDCDAEIITSQGDQESYT